MKKLFPAFVFCAALPALAAGAAAETASSFDKSSGGSGQAASSFDKNSGGSGQAYPAKSIRFIVPQAPGGTSDIVGRMVALKLSEAVRQPVIVDNRNGASGTIGSAIAAKAPAGGYTLLLAYTVHTTAPALYGRLPYDPVRSFTAITILAAAPLVLVVPPKVPVTTLAEFIRFAKTGGRPLTFGSAANGSGGHLAGELFRIMSQAPVVHVPYRGTGPAMTELIGGQIDFMFAAIIPVQPHVRSGRLRALAVSSLKRAISAPDVPTVAEAGLPGFEYVGWYGVLAPAGTPQTIVDRLHAEFVRIVRAPDMRERLLADGAEAVGNTPAEFAVYLKAELERWTRIIKEAGTRID